MIADRSQTTSHTWLRSRDLRGPNIQVSPETERVTALTSVQRTGCGTQGTTDPAVLAELARGRLRAKLPALREALAGRFRPHHAFLVSQLLAHIDYLDESIATVSGEVDRVLAPFAAQVAQVDTIPGINKRTAEVLVAEIGVDMSRFPSEHHLASWAGLCPGNNESAAKHKAGTTRKGDRWLRLALVEAALAAIRQATRRAVELLERQGYRLTLEPAV